MITFHAVSAGDAETYLRLLKHIRQPPPGGLSHRDWGAYLKKLDFDFASEVMMLDMVLEENLTVDELKAWFIEELLRGNPEAVDCEYEQSEHFFDVLKLIIGFK